MPTYNETVSVTAATSAVGIAHRSFAPKIINHIVATGQSATTLMGSQRNKSASNSATTSITSTVIRSRPYFATVSSTAASGATTTVLRGRLKTVNLSAVTGVSASATKGSVNSVSVSAHANCSAVRAASIFNRSISESAQTWVGVSYREKLAGVYFFWPPAGPRLQVGLRNPKFGNAHSLHLQTVSKRSRNGILYLFKRTPTYEQFKLDFDRIDETRFQNLISFMKNTAGQVIQYQDHKGVKWNGYILTDPFELVNDHKGLDDKGKRVDWYTLSLQFEGALA